MTLEEIRQYLTEHASDTEVINFLAILNPITDANVKAYLDSDKGKAILDSKVSTAIETWKKNNLQKIVEEEVTKKNPPKTEAEKRLAEMEKQLSDLKSEKDKEKAINLATKKFVESKLPLELIDVLKLTSEEDVTNTVNVLSPVFEAYITKEVEERFKGSKRDAPLPGTQKKDSIPNPFKKETWNLTQQGKLFKENPELYAAYKADAGIK